MDGKHNDDSVDSSNFRPRKILFFYHYLMKNILIDVKTNDQLRLIDFKSSNVDTAMVAKKKPKHTSAIRELKLAKSTISKN